MTPPPLLDAIDLTFAYDRRPVLRGVSLRLEPGKILALAGPNGSGKSTLLRVVLGQLAGGGTIAWRGTALSRWSKRALARVVAYLPQSPSAGPEGGSATVAETIAAGRYPHLGMLGLESPRDMEVATSEAVRLGLADVLSRPMATLSGGQRQRAFLARCLAQEPAALLLDEPDTHLDLRHTAALCGVIRGLAHARGVGVLVATHDLNVAAAIADEVLLLSDGATVASGPPAAVLSAERLTAVYGVPMVTWRVGEQFGVAPTL